MKPVINTLEYASLLTYVELNLQKSLLKVSIVSISGYLTYINVLSFQNILKHWGSNERGGFKFPGSCWDLSYSFPVLYVSWFIGEY